MKEKLLSDQTIVLVSHQSQMLKNFCNKVVWIENGISKMVGNSKDVVEAYESFLAGRIRKN
jgi:ABC-type polysaccharide/polyol phosphate transport system ATPase subunit